MKKITKAKIISVIPELGRWLMLILNFTLFFAPFIYFRDGSISLGKASGFRLMFDYVDPVISFEGTGRIFFCIIVPVIVAALLIFKSELGKYTVNIFSVIFYIGFLFGICGIPAEIRAAFSERNPQMSCTAGFSLYFSVVIACAYIALSLYIIIMDIKNKRAASAPVQAENVTAADNCEAVAVENTSVEMSNDDEAVSSADVADDNTEVLTADAEQVLPVVEPVAAEEHVIPLTEDNLFPSSVEKSEDNDVSESGDENFGEGTLGDMPAVSEETSPELKTADDDVSPELKEIGNVDVIDQKPFRPAPFVLDETNVYTDKPVTLPVQEEELTVDAAQTEGNTEMAADENNTTNI